jgi:hypothetical protein
LLLESSWQATLLQLGGFMLTIACKHGGIWDNDWRFIVVEDY